MSNCTHCVPTHDLISHLRYEHNLVRDTAIMAVAHLVWLLLALLLTYALLGLADNAEVLQLPAEVFQFFLHLCDLNTEVLPSIINSSSGEPGHWIFASH